MDVQHKDAKITNTDDAFPGAFRVILSAPTKDRDGDTLLPEDWKQPLPEHITFDADHGMSVATTVGSGRPYIDPESGNLVVDGTYSSLPRAQEVRTLVNEGHIRTTSVAFMSEKSTQKDGKSTTVRELLNGAFVAIPSNREALVLSSKSLDVDAKEGRRNNSGDAKTIQAIHDHASSLGASCDNSDGKSFTPPAQVAAKSVAGSAEAAIDRANDALEDAYGNRAVLRATLPDALIFDLYDANDGSYDTYRQPATDDGAVIELTGTPVEVDIIEQVVPDADADREEEEPPVSPATATAVAAETADESDADVVMRSVNNRLRALAIQAEAMGLDDGTEV